MGMREQNQINLVSRLLIGILAVCVLLWVALYNGYPTIFSDTGSYLLTGAFFIGYPPFRAPGYSLFTRYSSLGTSAWFTIAMQAAIVVYVLHQTCRYMAGSNRRLADRSFAASVCVLAALTSLPWLVSLLMPDVFAGVLFLTVFLLAFAGELRPAHKIALAAIVTISVGAHLSLLPIAILLVLAVLVVRHFAGIPHSIPSPRTTLAWLLVPIIAAGFCTAALNRKMGLGFTLSPSRNEILLSRLFADGLAADFLRENCPRCAFISCRYLSNLPRTQEEFVFQHPLLADLKGHEEEMGSIVRGTLLAYPGRFAISSVRETLRQLIALRTGDEIRTYNSKEWTNVAIIRVFPGDIQRLFNSRQYRDRLLPLVDAIAPMQTVVFWLSLPACLVLAWTGRFVRINIFLYCAIAFLIINATICATTAAVFDRYQSRVAWIVPFCLTAYICCLAEEGIRGIRVNQNLDG